MNYQNTLIYKIVPTDVNLDFVYVGHTTNFTQRKGAHKSSCCNENTRDYNVKVYKTIRDEIGGWEMVEMIMIEPFPCNSVYEAKARERYWLETLKANLNTSIPCRTHKEYRETHKESISEKSKEFYSNNKDAILVKQKIYSENNKEKIQQRTKIYNENNKEKIQQGKKKYAANHKEEKNEKARQVKQTLCDCGGTFKSISSKNEHLKTNKHQKYVEDLNKTQ